MSCPSLLGLGEGWLIYSGLCTEEMTKFSGGSKTHFYLQTLEHYGKIRVLTNLKQHPDKIRHFTYFSFQIYTLPTLTYSKNKALTKTLTGIF